MILSEHRNEFESLLIQAYSEDISIVKEKLCKETILSYCIFCDSAFSNFGAAVCTESWLKSQSIKIQEINTCSIQQAILYVEMHAAEWGYYSPSSKSFSAINNFTQKIRNADYDGDLIGIYKEGDFDGTNYDDYSKFYIDCIINIFEQLIKSRYFIGSPFGSDILLGLQYPDPTKLQQSFMIKVSEKVNSPSWHKKMLEAYSA